MQQAAGTTKVGYNAYYDHKLANVKGLSNFSCSRTDKEFWVHDQRDTEKDILKAKAHEKSFSLVSIWCPSGCGSRPAGCESVPGRSARSKHNKKQHELYQKCKKAKKAEQRKQAKAAAKAPDAAAVPTKSGHQMADSS